MIYKPSSLKLIKLINNTFPKVNDRDISNVLALQIDLTYLCRLSILAMQKHVTLPLGKVVVFQISWSFATLQIEIRAPVPRPSRQRFIKIREILVTRSIPSFSFSTAASTEVIRVVTREASTLCRNFSNHFWGQKKWGQTQKVIALSLCDFMQSLLLTFLVNSQPLFYNIFK